MKAVRHCIAGAVALTLCVSAASAHLNPADPVEVPSSVSAWAKNEVSEALQLGFGPQEYQATFPQDDYAKPIYRVWFFKFALNFVAYQNHCDYDGLESIVINDKAEYTEYGYPIYITASDTGTMTTAYYLGLIKGRGDGDFDGDSYISRQEAAVLLMRIYQSYGGIVPTDNTVPQYNDAADIASWASEGVAAASAMGVMKGDDMGCFNPNGDYTAEQCLVTLTRLYENLPVSRKNNNVTPLYSYEQYAAYIEAGDKRAKEPGGPTQYRQSSVVGPIASVYRVDLGGSPNQHSIFRFVYRCGGMRDFDLGICNNGRDYISQLQEVLDQHFSEDGKTFYCTITLDDPVALDDPELSLHSHEAGTYHITIDVETCAYDVQS